MVTFKNMIEGVVRNPDYEGGIFGAGNRLQTIPARENPFYHTRLTKEGDNYEWADGDNAVVLQDALNSKAQLELIVRQGFWVTLQVSQTDWHHYTTGAFGI